MDDDKNEEITGKLETAVNTLVELCGEAHEPSIRLQAAQRLLAHAEWKEDQ